jgi:predicted esterase
VRIRIIKIVDKENRCFIISIYYSLIYVNLFFNKRQRFFRKIFKAMVSLLACLPCISNYLLGFLQYVLRINSKLLFSFSYLFLFLLQIVQWSACLVLFSAAASVFALPGPAAGDGIFSDGQGNNMPYRVFLPSGYNSSQTYPLVLFLHGSTDGGTTKHIANLITAAQGGYGAQYKSILLIPQVQVPPGNYSWTASVSENLARGLLDLIISTYKIDTRRIYVTGLSMGGGGTFDFIAQFPNTFAAAAPLSGWGDIFTASIIKDTPIWAFHGVADSTVSVTYTDQMFDAVEAAGGTMEYTRVEGVGHSGWETFYNGSTYKNSKGQTFYEWMFAQSLPIPEPSSATLATGALALGLLCLIRRKLVAKR